MRSRKFKALLIFVISISLPLLVFSQRMAIFDWWRLRGYTPDPLVAQLATDTTMVDGTRRLFYVYHPSLEEKAEFNKSCRENEQTIVLGCYVDGRGIHLLNVNDSRLAGVQQVTAAHELLHAAYARLSTGERKKVDAMTRDAFAGLTDERVRGVIELYRNQDPGVVPNELHSILATEVRSLPAELEAYYAKHFSDRAKVVAYSEAYEQAFTARKNQILAYDAQLASLKQQIETLQKALDQQAAQLTAERAQLEAKKSSGDVSSYNAAVNAYNGRVVSYNRNIDRLTDVVNEYNDIVPKRNAIALEEQELVKAIDSRESVPGKQ